MQIYVLCLLTPNLSDYFNTIFWSFLIDKFPVDFICLGDTNSIHKIKENDIVISGIGSIIRDTLKMYNEIKKNVPNFKTFYIGSSGCKTQFPNELLENINVISLRGNITISDHNFPIGDNALYLPLIKEICKNNLTHDYDIGIIPHCVENDGSSKEIQQIFTNCVDHPSNQNKNSKILFINITDPLDKFISKIKKCKYILSSSLHGIIFSDSLNIPAYHLQLTNRIGSDFKFRDYYSSVTREYKTYYWRDFESIWFNNIESVDLPYYSKNINLISPLEKLNELNISTKIDKVKTKIINNKIPYLHFNNNTVNSDNIDENITVVIASCLIHPEKFNCLLESIESIRVFLPKSEIIVGFDNTGPNDTHTNALNKYDKLFYFTHKRGLGHTFNYGNQIATNNIILQTEDDWIIQNKYMKVEEDFKTLIFQAFQVLMKDNKSCVRLDGGMFDEVGGSESYQLGWDGHVLNDKHYYSFVLPSKKQMEENVWLHYAFCNHPHLKLKTTTTENPYPEYVSPGELENSYSVEWISKKFNIYYVPINEESIKIHGITNPDKNIFKHIGWKFSYRA